MALWVSWKPTYPRYTLAAADLLLRGVAERNGDGGGGGVHGVVFLPPAAWPPPADGSPPGRRGRGQFGFTTLLPSPRVSGGQQKRKRYTDFLLGPGAPEPRGSFERAEGWAGRWAGQSRTCPPTRAQPGLHTVAELRLGESRPGARGGGSPPGSPNSLFLKKTSFLRLTS